MKAEPRAASRPGTKILPRWQRVLAIIAMAGSLALLLLDLLCRGSVPLPIDPTPLVALTGSGPRRFMIEIARTDGERDKGLMFRAAMPDDHGMLFVFPRAQRLRFWMKDTPLALDILFIDDGGRVGAIRRGTPWSPSIIDSGRPARYVLELKAGTAAMEGIRAGDRIEHSAIKRRSRYPSMLAPSSAWTRPPSTVSVSPTT